MSQLNIIGGKKEEMKEMEEEKEGEGESGNSGRGGGNSTTIINNDESHLNRPAERRC